MFDLNEAKSRMSPHDEFILYDLRGSIVSISEVSESSSNSGERSISTASRIFLATHGRERCESKKCPRSEYCRAGQYRSDLQLDLAAMDRWTPAQGESTGGNWAQTRTLSMGSLLPTHRFLPEETFPGGQRRAFEQRVFDNPFPTTSGFDQISSIMVQMPPFTVVTLVRPLEEILLEDWGCFEVRSYTASSVRSERT